MTISAIRLAGVPSLPRALPRAQSAASPRTPAHTLRPVAIGGAAVLAAAAGTACLTGGPVLAAKVVGGGLAIAAAAAGIGLAALACAITTYGKKNERQRADCIIVLGTAVRADGTPGGSLAARVQNAESLYHQGMASHIIFTGGRGKSGYVESEVSRDVARSHGIPADRLLVECSSHNTYENFLYARDLMRQNGWKSCLVSTDPFHERRSIMIAREMGLDAHPAPTLQSPANTWKNTFRECLSTIKYTGYRWRRRYHHIQAGT